MIPYKNDIKIILWGIFMYLYSEIISRFIDKLSHVHISLNFKDDIKVEVYLDERHNNRRISI